MSPARPHLCSVDQRFGLLGVAQNLRDLEPVSSRVIEGNAGSENQTRFRWGTISSSTPDEIFLSRLSYRHIQQLSQNKEREWFPLNVLFPQWILVPRLGRVGG